MSKKLFILTLTAFCLTNLTVKAQENLHIDHLHAEMLRLISTPDKEGFTEVTEQLKEEPVNLQGYRLSAHRCHRHNSRHCAVAAPPVYQAAGERESTA